MEEVVLLLAYFSANDEKQDRREDQREERAREFYAAYIMKVAALGLWVPGRPRSAQPQTPEESIEMRTREGAASLLNRGRLIRSAVNKAKHAMAQVQAPSGYDPPSGTDQYQYWTTSATDAEPRLGQKAIPYFEHLSYVSPSSWRLDEGLRDPKPPRFECSFTTEQKDWFDKMVRPEFSINPKKRGVKNITQVQQRAPPRDGHATSASAHMGEHMSKDRAMAMHAKAVAYSAALTWHACSEDRAANIYIAKLHYAAARGEPPPPSPVSKPAPRPPPELVIIDDSPPPSGAAASDPSNGDHPGESDPPPESVYESADNLAPDATPHRGGEDSPNPVSLEAASPVPVSPNPSVEEDAPEDSPSPAALAAAVRAGASRRRTAPSSDASPQQRQTRSRPALPTDAFRDPTRRRLQSDGSNPRRSSARATHKPTRLVQQ